MIKLYYGKTNIDRAEFMFEKASERLREGFEGSLVLVPDRHTLETEKKAFFALKTRGLMNIEIMSFSRLAAKLIPGSEQKKYIDDLSRSMILRKVISEIKEDLRLFAGTAGKTDFVKMAGNAIQDFKQFGTKPDDVLSLAEEGRTDGLLQKKLKETGLIYEAYRKETEGRFLDTEDYLERLCQEIQKSDEFNNRAVFVMGFDFFTERLISVMEALAEKTGSLEIVMMKGREGDKDFSLFAPLEQTSDAVRQMAERLGADFAEEEIPQSFERKLSPDIKALAEGLYAFPAERREGEPEDVITFSCRDRQAEVTFAAREIRRLVEKEGLRFRDIAVAVPDLSERRSLIRREFTSEGISFFDDVKYDASNNRFMQFILAICGLEKGWGKGEDLIRLADTGLGRISEEEKEILENYAHKYKIEGYMWERPFYKIDRRKKSEEEAREELAAVEEIRKSVTGLVREIFEDLGDCKTGGDHAKKLFAFLKDRLCFEEKITEDGDRLKKEGRADLAEATVQLWRKTEAVFDRLNRLLEDYVCTREEFFEILRTGIETLDLGLIPAQADNVLVTDFSGFGAGEYRVLIVMGFNEDIIPAAAPAAGILNDRDREAINEVAGRQLIGKNDRQERERLEIYRTLTCPSEKLIITWGMGRDCGTGRPSSILRNVKRIWPDLRTVTVMEDEPLTGEYGRQTGREEKISNLSRENLYGREVVLSPTSLEAYGHCPFAHFLHYGLRTDERRVFEPASAEMGSVFHEIIMKFSERLTETHMWQSADPETCRKTVNEIAEESVKEFAGGQLFEGPVGEYRISRIKSVCGRTAAMAANHVQRGGFNEFMFEVPFGRRGDLPPVKIETEDGTTAFIEGRIDRIDVAEMPEGSCVKVIDYKSGADAVDEKEIRSGYKLQLMLYMMAAKNGLSEKKPGIVPAGVFYFKIAEPMVEAESREAAEGEGAEKLEKDLVKKFKMDGVVVNEPWIVEAIDEAMGAGGSGGFSDIVKLRHLKSGATKGTGSFSALTQDEFGSLLSNTERKAESFVSGFVSGRVSPDPMKVSADADACKYCRFKTICTVDTEV